MGLIFSYAAKSAVAFCSFQNALARGVWRPEAAALVLWVSFGVGDGRGDQSYYKQLLRAHINQNPYHDKMETR
jgi:hypothetical protein